MHEERRGGWRSVKDLVQGVQRVVSQGQQVQLGLAAGVHLKLSHQVVQVHPLEKKELIRKFVYKCNGS